MCNGQRNLGFLIWSVYAATLYSYKKKLNLNKDSVQGK